eukprot:4450792-Lingulodinium_polyedra.AAC.1
MVEHWAAAGPVALLVVASHGTPAALGGRPRFSPGYDYFAGPRYASAYGRWGGWPRRRRGRGQQGSQGRSSNDP